MPRPRKDAYEFGPDTGEQIRWQLPPIVGAGDNCMWLGNGGHITQDEFVLHPDALDGFSLLFDAQPDSDAEQMVLGGADSGGKFEVVLNESGNRGQLRLHVSDDGGSSFTVRAQLSTGRSHRVLAAVEASSKRATIYELQGWSACPGLPIGCDIRSVGTLNRFGPGNGQFTIGGMRENGTLVSQFTGKLANIAPFFKVLSDDMVKSLTEATENPTALSNASLASPSSEFLGKFRRDLDRLRRAVAKPIMDLNDLDDVSLVVYRWLFDEQPLLVDLCRMLGIQLFLPGATDAEIQYSTVVDALNPAIRLKGASDGPFGFAWKTLERWRSEAVLHAKGTPISAEMLVKFVCNKFGARHFDEVERKRWQRDLLEVSAGLQIAGNDALAFQMKSVVDGLLNSLAAIRAEILIG